MAINKQPIFTANPILVCSNHSTNAFGTFDPTASSSGSPTIFTATAIEGTLIERVTIQPMASPDVTRNTITNKLIYLMVSDYSEGITSILRIKEWAGIDMASTFDEPPYLELTFTGGLILDVNDSLLINQIRSDGNPAGQNGDGLTVIVEGSTYTAA